MEGRSIKIPDAQEYYKGLAPKQIDWEKGEFSQLWDGDRVSLLIAIDPDCIEIDLDIAERIQRGVYTFTRDDLEAIIGDNDPIEYIKDLEYGNRNYALNRDQILMRRLADRKPIVGFDLVFG